MANRSHSEVENSGNGRHLSITSVQELLNTFKDNLSEHLTEDNIVKINLDPVTNLIFKTYFKWFPYVITDDTKIKIKENFTYFLMTIILKLIRRNIHTQLQSLKDPNIFHLN